MRIVNVRTGAAVMLLLMSLSACSSTTCPPSQPSNTIIREAPRD